jgi:hypothetical protein
MNIVRLFLALLCPAAFGTGWGAARLYFDGGGAGNSQSTSNTMTENTDLRVVGGANSSNSSLQVDGSGNTIEQVDHGAVSGGLALALRGVEGAQTIAKVALASTGGLLDGVLRNTAGMNTQLIASSGDIVSDALSTTRGVVGDVLRNSNDQGRDLISTTRSLLGDALSGTNLLARDAMSHSNTLANSALSITGQQSQSFADQARQFTESIKDIKTSDVRVLVVAGLAVVGLGAVMLFRKKG